MTFDRDNPRLIVWAIAIVVLAIAVINLSLKLGLFVTIFYLAQQQLEPLARAKAVTALIPT